MTGPANTGIMWRQHDHTADTKQSGTHDSYTHAQTHKYTSAQPTSLPGKPGSSLLLPFRLASLWQSCRKQPTQHTHMQALHRYIDKLAYLSAWKARLRFAAVAISLSSPLASSRKAASHASAAGKLAGALSMG
jgi:hypothetical protein